MNLLRKARLSFAGVCLLLLIIIVACGEDATPAPAPAAPTPVAVDTQAIVADAVSAALAALPTPAPGIELPSAAEIAAQVQSAVQAALPDTTSAADIQAAVQAAAQAAAASASSGAVTVAEVQAAIVSALAAQQPDISASEVQTAIASALAAITPVATPVVTPVPKARAEGTLNIGVTAQGAPVFNLDSQGVQQSRYDATFTAEDWWRNDSQGAILPVLVKDWEVSSDGLSYTFYLQDGVPFHRGWGNYSADDFIFTLENVTKDGSIASSAGTYRTVFMCDGCKLEKIDSLTVKFTRPEPSVEVAWQGQRTLGARSKLHYDTVGEEQANKESIATGPFMLEEIKQDQFRRTVAVENHWRQTPEFAELVTWEIDEESTRLANFLTGLLDTSTFSSDTVQAIKAENQTGVQFMTLTGGSYLHMIIYGQQYHPDHALHMPGADGSAPVRPLGEGVSHKVQCLEKVWVSCDADTSSVEWEKARKVREALSVSIDRQKLVNNLAFGDGKPLYHNHWTGHDGRMASEGLTELTHSYDPARAKQLLTDAGVPNGFDIPLTLTEFGPAGPIASGEAVANMWQDVGINAVASFIPYPAWRPCTIKRTCEGIATHINNSWIEPLRIMPPFYHPRNAFNLGFEHPYFTAALDEAIVTTDTELRWERQATLSKWAFNNVMSLPLFERADVWPLGPKLGKWDVGTQQRQLLNNWEYAPHRN